MPRTIFDKPSHSDENLNKEDKLTVFSSAVSRENTAKALEEELSADNLISAANIIHDPEIEKDIISHVSFRETDIEKLKAALHQQSPITIETAANYYTGSRKKVSDIYTLGYFGQSKIPVKIFAEEFIPKCIFGKKPDPKALKQRSKFNEYQNYLYSHLHGKYRVIITGITEERNGEPFVVASRLKAMHKIALESYFNSNPDYCFKIGAIVPARITAVYPRVLYSEVGGIETVIMPNEISYSAFSDLRKLYKIGEGIQVYINNLQINPNTKEVTALSVSKRLAEKDPREEAILKYHKGMEVFGIVVRNIPQGSLIDLGDSTCLLATFNSGAEQPPINSEVIVRVESVNYKNKKLYGFIRSKSWLNELNLF